MIYVDIHHKGHGNNEYKEVTLVEITYPNEEAFNVERVKQKILPLEGHLNVIFGMYMLKEGFFNSVLQIVGKDLLTGKNVKKILPLSFCIITEHFE